MRTYLNTICSNTLIQKWPLLTTTVLQLKQPEDSRNDHQLLIDVRTILNTYK